MRIIATEGDIADGLAALLRLDPRLEPVFEAAGPVPLRRSPPGYAGLARIIVGQMVSRASAQAIWARLEAVFGTIDAETLAGLGEPDAARAGLSRAKARALRAAATACVEEEIDLDRICRVPEAVARAELTALDGIGPWTAEVYLLTCAGHPDIFPAGDVALRRAVQHGFRLADRPSVRDLASAAGVWAPWRSVAARLFWSYYAHAMARGPVALTAP
ncbi:DNA-3-methyladenine glycosylase family protein [Ensifer soli]|uniref:DNA-3-methyladenine glycosylase family protein n=1 Tax=Ciceribacter sp. sgz301302 TaxID=3342379 RepID=UPI0035B969AE